MTSSNECPCCHKPRHDWDTKDYGCWECTMRLDNELRFMKQ